MNERNQNPGGTSARKKGRSPVSRSSLVRCHSKLSTLARQQAGRGSKVPVLWILLAAVGFLLIIQGFTRPLLQVSTATEPIRLPAGEYPSFQPEGDIRRFAGETLYYDVSFLWFDNAATAKVSFLEEKGKFYSILEAETKGFVGWVTSYRKHIYRADFDILDGGRRLRSNKFTTQIIIGDQVEQTVNYMDYHAQRYWWFSRLNGELKKSGQSDIPKGMVYDDILTAFYNMRNNVYGKLRKGAEFTITTIPVDGKSGKIFVQVQNDEEKENLQELQGRMKKDELLIKIIIPKEVFKTKTGELWVWGSKHYIPLETTVKDYIFLGDLEGRFNRREYHPPPSLAITPAAANPSFP